MSSRPWATLAVLTNSKLIKLCNLSIPIMMDGLLRWNFLMLLRGYSRSRVGDMGKGVMDRGVTTRGATGRVGTGKGGMGRVDTIRVAMDKVVIIKGVMAREVMGNKVATTREVTGKAVTDKAGTDRAAMCKVGIKAGAINLKTKAMADKAKTTMHGAQRTMAAGAEDPTTDGDDIILNFYELNQYLATIYIKIKIKIKI